MQRLVRVLETNPEGGVLAYMGGAGRVYYSILFKKRREMTERRYGLSWPFDIFWTEAEVEDPWTASRLDERKDDTLRAGWRRSKGDNKACAPPI